MTGVQTCALPIYANVYGPRQDPHGEAGVVAIFCQRLVSGQGIQINAMREVGDPGCVRDYVYVKDVVKANLLAIQGRLEGRVINVGSGEGTSTLQLAERIEQALGVKADKKYGTRRAGDLERSVLEPNDELTRHAGPATPIADGIAETARWFAER